MTASTTETPDRNRNRSNDADSTPTISADQMLAVQSEMPFVRGVDVRQPNRHSEAWAAERERVIREQTMERFRRAERERRQRGMPDVRELRNWER